MRKITKLTLTALVLISYLPLAAQNQNQDESMKAMMAYMNPGDVHKMMAKSAGNWSGAISMWMQPNTPPATMTGDSKSEMILGGRYLQSKYTGSFNGMPFEGIGVMGYDNAKKIFTSSWIDNFGTGMMYLEGTWDGPSKTINFNGKMVDPVSGKDLPVRETLKFVDDNTQLFEMFVTTDGKEYKSMEIKYTRKM